MSFRRLSARLRGPASTPHRWTALIFLSLLQLLIAVDVTIVAVALPSIGEEFDADPGTLTWVVTGYTVVGGGLLALGGRLGDLLGRRRMLLIGAALFGAASLLAGLAPTFELLVVARFLQGAGEALASPAAMSLIALLFPDPGQRARALGVWGAVASAGLVIGVLLSGVLVSAADWRWIFLINPPLVIVVLVAVALLIRPDRGGRTPRLDLLGAALLTLAPLALVFGVVELDRTGMAHPLPWAAILVGVIAGACFVVVERRHPNPLVPLSLLSNRVRLTANVSTALLSAALSTAFFLLTFYLQEVLGFGPLEAGLAYLPFCAALLLAVTQVARLVERFGTTTTATIGLLAAAAGLAWLARLPVDGNYATDVLPAMVAIAVGMGVGLVALQYAALWEVDETDAGIAAGVQRSVDQLGGALGVAILIGLVVGSGNATINEQVDAYRLAFTLALVGLAAAIGLIVTLGPRRPKLTQSNRS